MKLTKEQEELILKEFEENPDLTHLTRTAFGNEELNGVSKEGRAVRQFLVKNKLEYKTKRKQDNKTASVTLNDDQKEFIKAQLVNGLSSWGIAQILFHDKEIKQLGVEQRAVLAYIKEGNPDLVPSKDSGAISSYVGPKSAGRIVKKINDATGLALEVDKLNRKYENCVSKLGIHLNNSRFVKIANNYLDISDRELFEQEFIRLTWDKPDLTADEINLYLNVCKEIINLEVVSLHLNKLNDMFDVADDQQEMSVRLAEIIKAKSSEYHQCESRVESLTKKLQGDRGERMKNKHKENASILSIITLFQEEDERHNLVRMVEMEKALRKEDAERLESMDEWVVRVMGVEKDDVI